MPLEKKIGRPFNWPYASKIKLAEFGIKKSGSKSYLKKGQTWKPQGLGEILGFHPKHDPLTAGIESFHCGGHAGCSFPP